MPRYSGSLIDRVLKRAKKRHENPPHWLIGSSGTDYYVIGLKSATDLVREAYGAGRRAPRVGYGVDLPSTTFNGHKGHWLLSNRGGKYELLFMYAG